MRTNHSLGGYRNSKDSVVHDACGALLWILLRQSANSGEPIDYHVLSPCFSVNVYRHLVDVARRQSSLTLPHLFHRSLPACRFSRWKAQPVSSLTFHLQQSISWQARTYFWIHSRRNQTQPTFVFSVHMASRFGIAVSRLDQSPITIGAVVLFSFALYYLIIRPQLRLRQIPGPWWAPFTRLWLFKTLASEDSPNRYIEVNEKYGMSGLEHIYQYCIVP